MDKFYIFTIAFFYVLGALTFVRAFIHILYVITIRNEKYFRNKRKEEIRRIKRDARHCA